MTPLPDFEQCAKSDASVSENSSGISTSCARVTSQKANSGLDLTWPRFKFHRKNLNCCHKLLRLQKRESTSAGRTLLIESMKSLLRRASRRTTTSTWMMFVRRLSMPARNRLRWTERQLPVASTRLLKSSENNGWMPRASSRTGTITPTSKSVKRSLGKFSQALASVYLMMRSLRFNWCTVTTRETSNTLNF